MVIFHSYVSLPEGIASTLDLKGLSSGHLSRLGTAPHCFGVPPGAENLELWPFGQVVESLVKWDLYHYSGFSH